MARRAGLILLAHGARDARWAEPFARIRSRIEVLAPGIPVEVAFLEFLPPDLASAVAVLAGAGATEICIVPVFLGSGGHVRDDIPAMLDAIRAAHPGAALRIAGAAGEDDGVLAAIAAYSVAMLGH